MDSSHGFSEVTYQELQLQNEHGGGTRPELGINEVASYQWSGDQRYAILITDGAPQGNRSGESYNLEGWKNNLPGFVRTAADNLKDNNDVKLITIGLSMDRVASGNALLYDIADEVQDRNMFFSAEKGNDLESIMLEVLNALMQDAIVHADVTDTVGEAFYLVNKEDGLPLVAGDKLDLEGNKLDRNYTGPDAYGIVQGDGCTVKWFNQNVEGFGWHGTVYVKAKEDLLGGNAVQTNSGEASVQALNYAVSKNGQLTTIPFDTSNTTKLTSLTVTSPTPHVNVNELTFPAHTTKETVYLGESVSPGEALKRHFDAFLVEEVVNEDGSLHYPLDPNSIDDQRESQASGTSATFPLGPVILEMIQRDAALSARYIKSGALDWEALAADAMDPDGVRIPYIKYGIIDNSDIVIKITKEGTGSDLDEHATVETGTAVEKYIMSVQYSPDYTVTPIGQGGDGNGPDYHTGTNGSAYPGHASGRETARAEHTVDVYVKGLQITKTDTSYQNILSNAAFTIYRTPRPDDDPSALRTVPGLTGSWFAAYELDCAAGTASIAELSAPGPGEKYYLVETRAPAGFNPLASPVELSFEMVEQYVSPPGSTDEADKTATPPASGIYDRIQTMRLILSDPAIRRTNETGTLNLTDTPQTSEEAVLYYRVANSAGYELPQTGGGGTWSFTLVGLILVIGAGLLLLLRLPGMHNRRKKPMAAAPSRQKDGAPPGRGGDPPL